MKKEEINKFLKECEERAKKTKFTGEDWNNLYDVLSMIDWQTYNDFKLNKIDKWFNNFFNKIEKIVIPELEGKE